MERRNFLKTAVLGSIATALQLKPNNVDAAQAQADNTDIVAIMGGEPDQMYKRAISEIGGIKKFIKKGDKVVIKPNIGWDKAPEMAADTNPILIGAIVKDCVAAGASQVLVFDHTCDSDFKSCYKRSGIEDEVVKAGGKMAFANDEKYYKEVDLPKGIRMKRAKIHEEILNCDKWINVPVLKNHGGAKMTISMKNYMGIVWDREYFHSNNLQQCIADACTFSKKPVLNIVDAYRIMTQNGPKGKSVNDVVLAKALFMSQDIVAVDSAAIKFFAQFKDMDIERVGHIALGEASNIGTSELSKLKIKKIKL
jgi:Uncharacterized conserved protein